MSEATKRKIVTHEAVHSDVTIAKDQFVVKVVASKGNNLHEVQDTSGHITLCSMPPKFRKSVWIKKGDFVVVEKISEGKKVTCEMVTMLYPPQIKDLKSQNEWPDCFETEDQPLKENIKSAKHNSLISKERYVSDSESDNDDDLEINVNQLNRPVIYMSESSNSEDSDDTQS